LRGDDFFGQRRNHEEAAPVDKASFVRDNIIKWEERNMRLTIDVDAKVLRRVQKATGKRKNSPAVREALQRYLRERERRELLRKILRGESDFGMTNEELEKLATYDSD
jgi:Arc/MetJ family transcription regulator